jgi:hypothetical protein
VTAVEYTYSQGNRLEDRNTYFYTRFQGVEFLDAWREARKHAARDLLEEHGETGEKQLRQLPENTGIDTHDLLPRLLLSVSRGELSDEPGIWTDILRRRFEISKRVFCAYAREYPHKPLPDSDWRDLELYTAFSALMEAAYAVSGDIAYLNALLKCNDTLVSVRHSLSAADRERLSDLLSMEEQHIRRLADSLEVIL